MWRRGSIVRVVDADARARRRAEAWSDLEELVVGVLWALFGWRIELLGLGAIVGVERLLAGVVGEAPAVLFVIVLLGAALAWRATRVRVLRLLRAMHLRRAWARA